MERGKQMDKCGALLVVNALGGLLVSGQIKGIEHERRQLVMHHRERLGGGEGGEGGREML